MPHNDFILRHIHTHHDPFVRDLYKELDRRIAILEEGKEEAFVERMTMRDYLVPIIVTIMITGLLIESIVSHL